MTLNELVDTVKFSDRTMLSVYDDKARGDCCSNAWTLPIFVFYFNHSRIEECFTERVLQATVGYLFPMGDERWGVVITPRKED